MEKPFAAQLNAVGDPDRKAALLRTKAKQWLVRHKYADARDLLSEALKLQPSSHKLYRLRSLANACLQDYEASLLDAERVIELMPQCADGFYHRGFALYQMKRYAEAAKAFQGGLEINPHDRVLKQGFWDSVTLLSQTAPDTAATMTAAAGGPPPPKSPLGTA